MGLKRTTEEVAKHFREHGCELLGEYTGALNKMKYRCSCGQTSEITWNNFTKGKRCGYCVKYGQKKKMSLKQVQKIFKDRGCQFLDSEYKGVHYKHHYRCVCGYEAKISFAAFYHQNQLCHECGLNKNRGPNHHMWIADRKKKQENILFRKKCYKALSSSLKKTGTNKLGHTSDMLGYTPAQLQEHIKAHPNWPNVKDASWHLDHIFPIQAFLDYGIQDMALINNLDNLQPLTGPENNRKSWKYDAAAFEKWLEQKGYGIILE